ncbi:MAG: 16S rRNA (cytidine(1402)-2'-O)-methyltransferase [Acidimicrobiaceae bacterium]|nr:16S rRNA (cytidine(1402)-2'-O)-methyltransferase [Acidimicrobiaceae bacterium]
MNQKPAARGQLMIVATPIGNLGDLSPRALALLESADAVYCEDTRHSRTLFSAHGISSRHRLLALHEHNEMATSVDVIERVERGELVVLISDAGTPGISDPGAKVVAEVVRAGLDVSTAPGPTAIIGALSVSGLSTERFVMEGFIGRKAGERSQSYELWRREPRTIVFYESPQRITATMIELAALLPERRAAVVRELTKLHEEVLRGTVAQIAAQLSAREVLGEIVVVLEGAGVASAPREEVVVAALSERLARGVSVRDAVAEVVEELGVARRATYVLALGLRANEVP